MPSCLSAGPRTRVAVFSLILLFAGVSFAQVSPVSPASPAPARGLRIVVLGGEDATNIIAQGTAVATIVEVRDRNNNPVAGAAVLFRVGGNATFNGGVRTLSVTTDATGRATASGINAVNPGKVQIQVRASYQGQTANTTITQSNVANAQQAQQAQQGSQGGQASQAAKAAGGAGGGAAGGLSALAIGGIAAGGGVGALVAVKVAGGDDSGSGSSGPVRTFAGPFTTTWAASFSDLGGGLSCVYTYPYSGTIVIKLDSASSSKVSGTLTWNAQTAGNAVAVCNDPSLTGLTVPVDSGPSTFSGPVTGTSSNVQFNQTNTIPASSGVTGFFSYTFSGSLNGDVITGPLNWTGSVSGSGLTWTYKMTSVTVQLR